MDADLRHATIQDVDRTDRAERPQPSLQLWHPTGDQVDRRDKGHHDKAMHYLCIGNTTRLGIARSM
ncbi:hypothetical protein CJO81_10055 [Ralstonia solanacearum]|uniref:Uncharacterized protein n=1 Tax=Ralstonia solanacearum TaxID=305 RepID=A0A0S4UHN5_RALSL|nr:hypothetical protein BCR16_10395 [Ralstonia solanacearum FJAT-1458]AST86636.1 hypothetical protein CIG66_09320 [Ralstonia pseudosolanacearum]AXV69385.1 hypothetical protein CJO74_08885 [Ralstonia solanacearum]AXV73733.1 hypothetical protein CJO75_09575 [Ralstonia solanacearum]AXV95881.1 hypothetical protein CJO80_09980 [Ralstonia solanacearum]